MTAAMGIEVAVSVGYLVYGMAFVMFAAVVVRHGVRVDGVVMVVIRVLLYHPGVVRRWCRGIRICVWGWERVVVVVLFLLFLFQRVPCVRRDNYFRVHVETEFDRRQFQVFVHDGEIGVLVE